MPPARWIDATKKTAAKISRSVELVPKPTSTATKADVTAQISAAAIVNQGGISGML
jgi:hypothetical protein